MATGEQIIAALEKGGYRADLSDGDAGRIADGWLAAWGDGSAPRRGLMLTGKCGCGKTLAAKALARSVIQCAVPGAVEWLESLDATDICAEGGWVLDDLGREAEKGGYGVRRNLVAEFLEAQYAVYKRGGWRRPPIITTNLTGEEIVRRYDAHLMSRIAETFVIVKCAAPDHRMARLTVIG